MENYFYRQLSKDAQAFVDEIEREIPNEIQIIQRKEKNNYGCSCTANSATIFAPRLDRLRSGPVIHELLHIKRVVIENIPALEVADHKLGDENFSRNIGELDNAIEHLAIVHHEICLWPDRKGYWGKILHRELRCLSARKIIDGDAKGHAILCWSLVKRSVPSKKLLRDWQAFLDINGIFYLIDTCSDIILKASSKQEIAEVLLPAIGIPLSDIDIF